MILLSNAKVILAILLRPFGFFPPKNYKNYLDFQSFDVEHTWWRLFSVVHAKLEIYVFIIFARIF